MWLERSKSLGAANFERSVHSLVWNKHINRQHERVGGCSHACYADPSVLWKERGYVEGRGRVEGRGEGKHA